MNIQKQKEIMKQYRNEYMADKKLENAYYIIENENLHDVCEINEENKERLLLRLELDNVPGVYRYQHDRTVEELENIIANEPLYKPYKFTEEEYEARNYCTHVYFNGYFIDFFYLKEDEIPLSVIQKELTDEDLKRIDELEEKIMAGEHVLDGLDDEDTTIASAHYTVADWHWYVLFAEKIADDYMCFGLVVNDHCTEMGYFRLSEITDHGAVRDIYFKPTSLEDLQ